MKPSAEDIFGRPPPPFLCAKADVDSIAVDNGIDLALFISETADQWAGIPQFTPAFVRECNRIAMSGIYACAGEYRTECLTAGNFVPPDYHLVPGLVEEMCAYANSLAGDYFHSAAYLLWRTNWIHPFYDGNGRVARELSYLALLASLGAAELEGKTAIPELLVQRRDAYYEALNVADRAWEGQNPANLMVLESLLCELYFLQIESAS